MGLAGGIVRRVFFRSPCSSSSSSPPAGSARGHSERSSVDHKSRWGSLRLYLCGDEITAAAAAAEEEEEEEDNDETVSVGSFETCAMPPPQDAPDQPSDVGGADNSREELQEQGSIPENEKGSEPPAPASIAGVVDEAATTIQSAFKGFMARRKLQELKRWSEKKGGCAVSGEPRSPTTSASIAASVEVHVGESLSNLRLSEEESVPASEAAQHRSSQRPRPPQVFRVKEEWDDSTVSSNVSRMRMRSRIEATTRRERALAYAFSQQLRSGGGGAVAGGGGRKRATRPEQGEFNLGWSWLERWMATRQAEPAGADDCLSKNAGSFSGSGSGSGARRVIVVRRRHDLAGGEEKESCGSNDVSTISFDGSSSGGRNGLSCYKPGGKNRLRGGRNLHPRRKSAPDHRLQARSHKVSKKVHQREDQTEAEPYDDSDQPPTDY